MIYDKVKYLYGSPFEYGYRVLDDNGIIQRLTDLDGNTLDVEGCGYECILPNPLPSWAT
jgi:hypothetical protein